MQRTKGKRDKDDEGKKRNKWNKKKKQMTMLFISHAMI